jgi:20S proteasome subunit alpha 3
VEIATVGRNNEGKIYHHIWRPSDIDALLKKEDLLKKDTTT